VDRAESKEGWDFQGWDFDIFFVFSIKDVLRIVVYMISVA